MSKHNRLRRQEKTDKRVHKVQLTLTLTKKDDGKADQHYDVHCATLAAKDIVFALRTAADLLEKQKPGWVANDLNKLKEVTDGRDRRPDADGAGEPAPPA